VFIKVGDHVNAVGRDAHGHMLLFLGLTDGDPGGGFSKEAILPDFSQNQAHESGDEAAVPPAGGFKSGPEVAAQAAFAGGAVIQKKAVGAA